MLPSCRQNENLYQIPQFDLTSQNIKEFSDELDGFHSHFHDCFKRSESRDHFLKYMGGQFSELERKSIEPMALNIKGGNLGKVDNCQVGVFAAYASEVGYSIVDKRLFIPERWFDDAYEERRKKCKLPADTVFRTKPQLAAEMLNFLAKEGTLPFKYIYRGPFHCRHWRKILILSFGTDVKFLKVPKAQLFMSLLGVE